MPGGMEQHIARLSEEQRLRGIEVVNVYNTGDAGSYGRRIWPAMDLSGLRPNVVANGVFYAGALLQVSRLRSSAPTVLHVHGAWSDLLFSKLLARLLGARAVAASVHDVLKPPSPTLFRIVLSHCGAVFATGRREADFLAEALRRPVFHTPSAPADLFFQPRSGRHGGSIDVVSVASLVEKKRLDLVIACARERPHLQFAIVGDGPLRPQLQAAIDQLALTNVRLTGRLAPAEVADMLASARIFLSTSKEEGTPTSALEAMATGTPVILSPSNDYGWLIETGLNGFVTQDWELESFLRPLDRVMADPQLLDQIGRRGRTTVSAYSWASTADRITAAMEAALAGEGVPCRA